MINDVQWNRTPKAKEVTVWLDNEVLPTNCEKSEYNMDVDVPEEQARQINVVRQATLDDRNERTLDDLSVNEILQALKRQAEQHATDMYETRMKIQEAEHRVERAEMQTTINSLKQRVEGSLVQLGFQALIARDNVRENDVFRTTMNNIKNRVAPDMRQRPDKETVLSCRVTRPRSVRVLRGQRDYVGRRDEMSERRFVRRSVRLSEKINQKRSKCDLRTNVRTSTVHLCANAVQAWLKVRETYPYFFFGMKYRNRAKTEITPLTRTELLIKYNDLQARSRRAYLRNSSVSYDIEEFRRLKIAGKEDLFERCLFTAIDDLPFEVDRMCKSVVDELNAEIQPNKDGKLPTRPDTVADLYNSSDLYDCVVSLTPIETTSRFFNNWPSPDTIPTNNNNVQRCVMNDDN